MFSVTGQTSAAPKSDFDATKSDFGMSSLEAARAARRLSERRRLLGRLVARPVGLLGSVTNFAAVLAAAVVRTLRMSTICR